MSSRRKTSKRGVLIDLGLALFVAACLGLVPRLIDGHAAFQWTRFHVARGAAAPRPGEQARAAARSASRALDRAAPLPFAADAAGLALGLGRRLELKDLPAALSLYTEVRASLERTRISRWRGLGLAGLAAEARRLEEGARARRGSRAP